MNQQTRKRPSGKPTFGIVINSGAGGFSQKYIDLLITHISRSHANWHVIDSRVEKETVFQIKKLLRRGPIGIIACGGDSTVNLVARNLIRRTSCLGILPLGRFNNIYRSIYGKPNPENAITHIVSRQDKKIDYGVAGNRFFLGSVGFGLIPNMLELINQKRIPRFGIGWSRFASQAAAEVRSIRTTLTVDEFKFDIRPVMLNVNLLPYSIGLPLVTSGIDDDGKAEIIFDPGHGEAIFSSYVRKIYRNKYIYSDEIRLYRGNLIKLAPAEGRKMYLDGELIDQNVPSLEIKIFPGKIRTFYASEKKE